MRFGIKGLLGSDLIDLSDLSDSFLGTLETTPSAALGSCRHKLEQADLHQALETIRQQQCRQLIYIGGNDSADTSHQVHLAAQHAGLELAVVGIPKTID